jgi:hypothetical protein
MAFSFNGSNQMLSNNVAVLSANPITMSCWARPERNDRPEALMSLGSSTTLTPLYVLRLRGDLPGDQVDAQERNDANQIAGSQGLTFAINTWQHFCSVFATTSSRTVYVDGTAAAENTTTITGTKTMDRTALGVLIRPTPDQYFQGRLAECAIWNAALTAAEIASLAKGMTPDKIRPQNLVFYAPLVRNLQDVRGGLTITNNNGATVANHPRVYA